MHRIAIVLVCLFAPAVLLGAMERNSQADSADRTRVCTPATGNVAKITTSPAVSAAFGALNAGSVYLLRCSTETYIATGATSPTATSSNFPLPVSVFPLLTTDSVKYVAGLAVTTAGTCWIWECK